MTKDKEKRKQYNKKYYEKNKESLREHNRIRAREWRKNFTEEAKELDRLRVVKYKKERSCNNKVFHEIEQGRMERPVFCGACGKEGFVQAHHEDYDKPLQVLWLCKECHINRHAVLQDLKERIGG